jgi:hypothetical protein
MNRKGSVLIHVLVTGVIVSLITAGILRMTMMNYVATARAAKGAQNRKEADAVLQRALTYWNNSNQVCSNNVPGLTCSGPGVGANLCNCRCPSSGYPAISVSDPDATPGPPCNITIESSDPQ